LVPSERLITGSAVVTTRLSSTTMKSAMLVTAKVHPCSRRPVMAASFPSDQSLTYRSKKGASGGRVVGEVTDSGHVPAGADAGPFLLRQRGLQSHRHRGRDQEAA